MARLDRVVADEFDSNRISGMLPASALTTYADLINEIYSITNSDQPEVVDFRKKVIGEFNGAVTRCYDLSLKDRFGRAKEKDFWMWLNHYVDNNKEEPFVFGMLRDISSALSSKVAQGDERQDIRIAPKVIDESYQGRFSSRWGDPLCYGLSESESRDLMEQIHSHGAQD